MKETAKPNEKQKLRLSVLFVLLAALAALVFQTAFANAVSTLIGGTLAVSGIKYTPSPAEPGRYIDVFISLDNGAYPINNVECRINAAFPFSVDDESEQTKSVAFLPVGQGMVLKYKVRVAADAVTGNNDLLFSCRSQGVDWVQAKMQVYVKVQEAVVSIPEIKLEPNEVRPGQTAQLSFKLENTGNSPVKDLSLKLVFSDATPFAAVGSSSEKRVALLEPKANAEISFQLLAFPTAAVKAYRLPIELTYYDDAGNKKNRSDYASIVVESKPELAVALESSTLYKNNSRGEIVLRVVNRGIADAKFLEVEVLPVAGLQVISGRNTYVGALDSDDYQTVELKVYAETPANEIKLPVRIAFKDANNRAFEQEEAVSIKLYSQAELEKYGFEAPQGMLLTIVAALAVLAAAYFAYKKFWKNAKNAKK